MYLRVSYGYIELRPPQEGNGDEIVQKLVQNGRSDMNS